MEEQLANYFEKIKFLPGNNRSLLLLDLPKETFLDLKTLEDSSSHSSFNIIKAIIGRENIIQISDPSEISINHDLHHQIHRIHRNERLIFEERGGKDLYIGWPFVRGKLNDGTLVRCPFIFFPFSLKFEDEKWYLIRREDVNITLNKTFLLRYAYHNKVTLSEEIIELVLNGFDADSTLFRSEIYSLLKNSELEIEFNQRNFIDELKPFQTFEQSELEKNEETGKLRLYPYATLGIFPQAGAYLISDYDVLLNSLNIKSVNSLLKTEQQTESSAIIPEKDIYTPLTLDGYQENALRIIKAGKSIAVNGPPGTGKSQLISNLMCDFIAHGKSVLLVSQKATALNVVYRQLQSLDLGSFIGLVHDFKNERKNIYAQITKQIESLNEYRQKNTGLEIDQITKLFDQLSNSIEEIINALNDFKHALFDDQECGKSIKELYLLVGKGDDKIQLNQIYRNYKFDKIEKFLPALGQYMEHHRKFESGEHFWTRGPSLSKTNKVNSEEFSKILDEVYAFDQQLKEESKNFTKNKVDFETALFFLSNIESLQQLAENLQNESTYSFYIHMVDNVPEKEIGWLSQIERNLLQCFKGAGPEISLPSNELGRFQEALEHAIKARKGIISWFRWKLFSEDKIFITRILVANDLKSNKAGFETLLERIDNRLNFEHLISEINEQGWLKDFPDNFRKIDIQNWFFYQKLALKSFHLRNVIRSLPNYILAKTETLENYVGTIQKLIALVNKIPDKLKAWEEYLNEAQVRYLLLGKTERSSVEKQLQEDLDDIMAYHAVRDSFEQEEMRMIDDLAELEKEGKGKVETLFLNSICSAWIDHIEQKFPVLQIASSQQIEKLSEDLQSAIDEKIRVSRELLAFKAREKAISSTEKEGVEASYEELTALLNDTEKNWPIRRVVSHYDEEIFSLLPCWISTPESASAIFPMKEIFDLVIFDESMSCLAERGLPVLFRGKSCMVLGDEQQLTPSNIYDNGTFYHDDLTKTTIYNLIKDHLEVIDLKRHYNATDLSLISFSNKHFYENQLKSIPLFNAKTGHGLYYKEVNGKWSKEGNYDEAKEIVRMVTELVINDTNIDLGIITLSTNQSLMIMDLLDKEKLDLPESFFVKTFENVQGDVRDHIIFTTSYSQWNQFDEVPKQAMNVVSTRARVSMTLVTSLHQAGELARAPESTHLINSYMLFAKNGGVHPTENEEMSGPNKVIELKSYLLENTPNKNVLTDDLPFADGAIKISDQYKGIILTDDRLNDESSKDAFCNIYNLLREKKWSFIQFYSREFWEQQTMSNEKLDRFISRET